MRKTRLLAIMAAVVCSMCIMKAEDIPARIYHLNEHNGSLTAQFTETKVLPRMKKQTIKTGTLYFKSAGERLLLLYDNPAGEYTLIKDGVMYVNKDGKKQRFLGNNKESRMSQLKSSLLYAMTGNVEAVAKENKASISSEESTTRYKCVITRKVPLKQGINSLTLIYDKATGGLVLLRIEEANGNYTTYETTNADVKTVFSDDVFNIQ